MWAFLVLAVGVSAFLSGKLTSQRCDQGTRLMLSFGPAIQSDDRREAVPRTNGDVDKSEVEVRVRGREATSDNSGNAATLTIRPVEATLDVRPLCDGNGGYELQFNLQALINGVQGGDTQSSPFFVWESASGSLGSVSSWGVSGDVGHRWISYRTWVQRARGIPWPMWVRVSGNYGAIQSWKWRLM